MSPDAAIQLWSGFALYGFTPNVLHHEPKEPDHKWVDAEGNPLAPTEEEPEAPLDAAGVAFLAVEAALNKMERKFPRRILRRALILMYHDQLPLARIRIVYLPCEDPDSIDALEWCRRALPAAHAEILEIIDTFVNASGTVASPIVPASCASNTEEKAGN